VAKLLKAMVGSKFVAVEAPAGYKGKYAWYELVQPGQAMKPGEVWKYRLEIDPDGLHIFIVECLAKVYEQQVARLKDRRDEATEEAEMKYFGKILDTFSQYKTKLHNNGFQRGAIEQAVYYFRDRCFTEQLDSYENILGVGNGILKLGKSPKLITGFHEYKISKFTSVNYVPFDATRPSIKLLLSVFADIFPEPDVLLYMLCLASTGLDHYEAANILTMLVGGGCNGKTFFMKMVHNALENMYCAVLKPALLTAPNEKAEAANPALMQMRDKTFGYFDEFQKCEFINIARMKSLTNPGWQSGRDNYEKASNFKNTANLITASNFEFIVDSTDHGTWRRIYHYTMKIKFCEKPDPNNPNEKKINPKLIDCVANDPEYKEAMLSILTEYNRILHVYYDNDIKNIPVPTIHYETEVFRSKQDSMNKFITTHIVKSPEYEEITSVTTIAAKYREWYKLNYKRDMSMIEAESQIENSRVGKLLTTLGSIKVLSYHRLRASPEEPTRDGESLLGIVEPPKQETYELPDFSVCVAPKKQKQRPEIPEAIHIQNSDQCDSVNNADIEELLAQIENSEEYNIDATW
jgi:phage/plasmid-associated DNA primase